MIQVDTGSGGASSAARKAPGAVGRSAFKVLVVLMAALFFLLAVSAPAPAEETTSATAGEDETASATAGEDETTSAAGGEDASSLLLPAPEGYEPLNPGLTLPEMQVQVWPEYDTGDVLVLLDVFLPETTTFPFTFSYYVPKGARNTGIAEINEAGEFVYSMTPDLTPGEQMDSVTLEVPKYNQLRLEYYYDPGVSATGTRSFPVEIWLPADVANLSVSFRQPLRSTGFAVEPALSQSGTDSEGFNYVGESFSGVEAGARISADVTYAKEDADPSVGEQDAGPGGDGSGGGVNYFLWAAIAIAVGVLAVAGYQLGVRRASSASSPGSGSGKTGRSGGSAGGGPARFCTECGTKLSKRDRFCSECGAPRD